MRNSFNIQSVDVEGVINSTAYAVKAKFAESDVVSIIIVPKEADSPVPTNYETIMRDTEQVYVQHHILDASSMEIASTTIIDAGIRTQRGDWQI
jgi:hypothetical protein